MTHSPKDGGPAFPACNEAIVNGTMGMGLRDWFAGQAVAGIAAGYWGNAEMSGLSPQSVADAAYQQADAMLAARATGEKETQE